ncbi:hypothetical protein FDI69_gp215 [Rhodococcus phage Trina]|uniref:Uncharacterized protein n=1 Tax=Rhodococcus phage Trina TaxID=2027905 RepID=A0A2D0ZN32_9CAUD|nr:hypothetical protein FDI69_gp215 [Rhodococcus phage Trina]ASZ74971.1 hypothetical protein SEA_TRINA_189 [Rhodococcus phage Trina]
MLAIIGFFVIIIGFIMAIIGLNTRNGALAFIGVLIAFMGPLFIVQSGVDNDRQKQLDCEQRGGAMIQDGPSSNACYKIINDKMIKIDL